eukprot:1446713-Ditylum_brightwellii.AAC.1
MESAAIVEKSGIKKQSIGRKRAMQERGMCEYLLLTLDTYDVDMWSYGNSEDMDDGGVKGYSSDDLFDGSSWVQDDK